MSSFDQILKELEAHSGALKKGVGAIGDIARDALTSSHHDTAAAALSAVVAIVEALFDGFEGNASPQDIADAVDKAIHQTLDRLASNDAKHDHRLEELDKGDGNNG